MDVMREVVGLVTGAEPHWVQWESDGNLTLVAENVGVLDPMTRTEDMSLINSRHA